MDRVKKEEIRRTGIVVATVKAFLALAAIAAFIYAVSFVAGYGFAGGAILAGFCLT